MSFWEILEIAPTDDKKEIQQAYSRLLSIYHPEENPEEFQQIHKAYTDATQYLRQRRTQQAHAADEPQGMDNEIPQTHSESHRPQHRNEPQGMGDEIPQTHSESHRPQHRNKPQGMGDEIPQTHSESHRLQNDLGFDHVVEKSEMLEALEQQLIEQLLALPREANQGDLRRWKVMFHKSTLSPYLVLPNVSEIIWQHIKPPQCKAEHYSLVRKAIKALPPSEAAKLDGLKGQLDKISQKSRKQSLIVMTVFIVFYSVYYLMAANGAFSRKGSHRPQIEHYFEQIYQKDFQVTYDGSREDKLTKEKHFLYTVVPGENADSTMYDIESFFYYVEQGEKKAQMRDEYMWEIMQSIAEEEEIQRFSTSASREKLLPSELQLYYKNSHSSVEDFVERFARAEQKLQKTPIIQGTKIEVNIRQMKSSYASLPSFHYEIEIGKETDIEDFRTRFSLHEQTHWGRPLSAEELEKERELYEGILARVS